MTTLSGLTILSDKRSQDSGYLIDTCGYQSNCQIQGDGEAVLLLHGSGPGVTALANWRGIIPILATERRVIAPDLVGFGYTQRPSNLPVEFMQTWTEQIITIMDRCQVEKADVVGNSFGGALALALAAKVPERIGKLVLMGSAGTSLTITPELDFAWGYTPSMENMRRVLESMVSDADRVTEEVVKLRMEASMIPGFQEKYAALFPAPRQRWLDALVVPEQDLNGLTQPTLLIHGREDRVVPMASSLALDKMIENTQLEIFDNCGHWVMIEQAERFISLVRHFLADS